jgi:four helix bundle protein
MKSTETSFEDLEAYTAARKFRKRMYRLAGKLPDIEKFNLAPQVRDAARSLTNNIAEGHGRFYYKENLAFQRKARGSLNELIDDINVCIDENYFETVHLEDLKEEAYSVRALLSGYIRYLIRESKRPVTKGQPEHAADPAAGYGRTLDQDGEEESPLYPQ